MAVITVKNLMKEYKNKERKDGFLGTLKSFIFPKYNRKIAVNNINFTIEKGECVGYIGENGAGKSTTIKMLTGILHPTSGEVITNGLIPYKNNIKNNMNIGIVFGQRTSLWWDLPVIESFKLNKRLYEISEETYNQNMQQYDELLKLSELLNIPVRNLSLGERMKCEIALAFLHNPQIVYLDEPTIGLDVLVKEDIRNFIKKVNIEKSTTVILTTHDLKDIEEICKRIILIDKGEILYDGDIESFVTKYGVDRIIKFQVQNIDNIDNLKQKLESEEHITKIMKLSRNEIELIFDKGKITANTVIRIVSEYCEIVDLSIVEPNMELIVKDIYRRGK
jgi:ABC-type uncharacterized transport system, ATPase component